LSCAETAESIEMQFGMLSGVGPGNMYYMGVYMPPRGRGTCGVSGRLKITVKHRTLGGWEKG